MNQHQLNKEIEAFIRRKDTANEGYSQEDIAFIQHYGGAGGQGSKGAKGEGLLYEFYTPGYVCELMFQLAQYHGYDEGYVLEPSVATGNMVAPVPDKSKVVGFETNHYTKRICELTYPEAKIYEGYFETAFLNPPRFTTRINDRKNYPVIHPDTNHSVTLFKQPTWLSEYPFSLVIGNPPYGSYKNKYSSYFKSPKFKQIEIFFMYYGMKLLKKGGLLIYLTSSNFLRNGISYNYEKNELAEITEFIDAYRLPPVFKNSDVPVDILIFRRK